MNLYLQTNTNELAHLYLKNPESSALGKKIVQNSIHMIDELGMEHFTFKKLSIAIGSNEASVYRYFKNKHQLLTYLVSHYWMIVLNKIKIITKDIYEPWERLNKIVDVLTMFNQNSLSENRVFENLKLHHIVISESAKVFMTKEVDIEEKKGCFIGFENLVNHIALVINQVNPDYSYPKALATNLIETSNEQLFFAEHFKGLTELKGSYKDSSQIRNYVSQMIFQILDKPGNNTF